MLNGVIWMKHQVFSWNGNLAERNLLTVLRCTWGWLMHQSSPSSRDLNLSHPRAFRSIQRLGLMAWNLRLALFHHLIILYSRIEDLRWYPQCKKSSRGQNHPLSDEMLPTVVLREWREWREWRERWWTSQPIIKPLEDTNMCHRWKHLQKTSRA